MSSQNQKRRILLAEPEAIVALDLGRRLERFGYEVAGIATTSEECARMAEQEAPDILLCNVELSEGDDGIAAASEAIRRRKMPVIMLMRPNYGDATMDRIVDLNPAGLILVPFKERELYITIELALAEVGRMPGANVDLPPGEDGVLIVDDEPVIAFDLQRRLEWMGYPVVGVAGDGEEAIRIALETRPAIVLMDYFLSRPVDGDEATIAIKKALDIPVIYVEGYTDRQTFNRLIATRPEAIMLKPFKERELAANIDLALSRYGNRYGKTDPTGLHFAARRNNAAKVAELLGQGANPDSRDFRDMTLLMLASRMAPDCETMRCLLDAGADVNAVSKDGRTALMLAAAGARNAAAVAFLLESGASIDMIDSQGMTALMHAASTYGREEALSILLGAGAIMEHENAEGWTALGLVIRKGYVGHLKLLLSRQAGPDIEVGKSSRLWNMPCNAVDIIWLRSSMSCSTPAAGRGSRHREE